MDIKATAEYFMDRSVFVFTTDIDFAPEWAIRATLEAFDTLGIPITPFITHKSEVIEEYYSTEDKRKYVGLHPYSRTKYQGDLFPDMIHALRNIWPEARTIRHHGYATRTKEEVYMRHLGFEYDSNLCLLLQPYSTPLRHCSGLIRYPIWLEDDVHLAYNEPLTLSIINQRLETPGMKIIDIHPILFALNANKRKQEKVLYYEDKVTRRWKKTKIVGINDENWQAHVSKGTGVQQFIKELIGHVKNNKCDVMYLDDLHEKLKKI